MTLKCPGPILYEDRTSFLKFLYRALILVTSAAVRTLLLDAVHVHHVAAHGVFSRENSLTDRADRIAPVYTAMVG